MLFIDSSSFLQRFKMKLKNKNMQADVEAISKENERLRKESEDLKTNPKVWEKKARELGMQKEDEEIYIFKEKDKKTD